METRMAPVGDGATLANHEQHVCAEASGSTNKESASMMNKEIIKLRKITSFFSHAKLDGWIYASC